MSTFRMQFRLLSSQVKLPDCNIVPPKYKGPPFKELDRIRKSHLNPALFTYYSQPLVLHYGSKQWVFDTAGKRYLDMFAGICTVSVGHSHPKITEALTQQASTLGHISNLYYHPKIHEYATRLTEKFPKNLKVVYFVNSGSEANDLAVLMARLYTQNYDILTINNGYHGMTCQTMALTSLSSYKYSTSAMGLNGVSTVMVPDVFTGIWGGTRCRDSPVQLSNRPCNCSNTNCEASKNYVLQVEDVFKYRIRKGGLAGFFAESIQGVGGVVQFPRGYLKDVYRIVKDNGGLFISDEVQTGFGRTGEHFWGFEMHDIQPDIVTMAKGIGNGFPLGAVVTTPEIAEVLSRASHFNTFGGNPLACTVGITVLDIIEEEKLQANSLAVGTYLLHELEKLQKSTMLIGDVRGKGLMIGVELIEPNTKNKPLKREKFVQFWDKCREYGLLVGCGGIAGNVIRIKPPMCISKKDAHFTVQVFEQVLQEIH